MVHPVLLPSRNSFCFSAQISYMYKLLKHGFRQEKGDSEKLVKKIFRSFLFLPKRSAGRIQVCSEENER